MTPREPVTIEEKLDAARYSLAQLLADFKHVSSALDELKTEMVGLRAYRLEMEGVRASLRKIEENAAELVKVRVDRIEQEKLNARLAEKTSSHERMLNFFWQKIVVIAVSAAALAVGAGVALLKGG